MVNEKDAYQISYTCVPSFWNFDVPAASLGFASVCLAHILAEGTSPELKSV